MIYLSGIITIYSYGMSSLFTISRIGPGSDVLLRNLFEHYIHDMAEWFEIDTKADGSYSYDTSLIWERGYDVWLAKAGDSIAGFAIVGSASAPGGNSAHDMREFFVIRRFRRNGFGDKMAAALWENYSGDWLIRVLQLNAPAAMFWRAVVSLQSQSSYSEEVVMVNGRPWIYFRFQ